MKVKKVSKSPITCFGPAIRLFFDRCLASALLIGFFAVSTQAVDNGSNPSQATPNGMDSLRAAELLVKAKDYDAAEKALLALDTERGFDDAAKGWIGIQLMNYYSARTNFAKTAEYARKVSALSAADVRHKTEALSYLAGSTAYWARFMGYYMDLNLDKKDLARMQKEELVYREELAALNPTNADVRIDLGYSYIEAGDAAKAAAAFDFVMKLGKTTEIQLGDALVGLANAAILKGDRPGAIRYCQDLVDRKLNTERRYGTNPSRQARLALQYLGGYRLDGTRLPFHTGAKAFPTPQQARYSDDFAPLKTVSLDLGKGLREDDPRILLLKQKVDRLGIRFERTAPFVIRIDTVAEPQAPSKPEGYALTVTKGAAVINGFDKQGVLWGLVSLIQLIDQDKKAIRLGEIMDYPNTAKRGFLEGYWGDTLEFGLFAKMNSFTAQTGMQLVYNEGDRPWTPLQRAVAAETCHQFHALGLDYYMGISGLTMYPKMPLSSDRTLDLLTERCSFIAEAGGHIYFPYDDSRYPLHPVDVKKFGNGSKMDAKRINLLYKAVHDKYPDFKLVFCPPYYAVPDGMGSTAYVDNRDEYLKSIGDDLDPAVEIYWTGPRVAGLEKPKEKRDFYANLIKRNPAIFQNRVRPHNGLSYITDTITGWKEWHYDGFVEKDITLFHKNGCSSESTLVLTLADYLWNVKAYDAERSIREAVALLYGKDMFALLDPGTQALAYLDKYKYGAVTPEALTEIPKIEECYAIAKACYEKALVYNGFSMSNYPASYGRAVGFTEKLLADARNPPDFMKKYRKDIEDTRGIAEKEVGVDTAKGDIFKSPIDFQGGNLIVYGNKCPKRLANLLNGKRAPASSVTMKFECSPFPPEGDYELHMSGQQESQVGVPPCAIKISLNGKTIFEGPSKFVKNGWSIEKFILPFDKLLRYNAVVVENIEDSSNPQGPPWFMVNYAVIKKVALF